MDTELKLQSKLSNQNNVAKNDVRTLENDVKIIQTTLKLEKT